MTTITIDRAVVEQALHVAENAGYPLALIKALRAALEQQAEPVRFLIEGNEFLGPPPAPYSTWGDALDSMIGARAIQGLRISALAQKPQPVQEICPGCEATLGAACGRESCPKGWEAAPQPQQAEPVAWMDPASGDVISDARHEAWERDFGLAGKGKAALFTVPLYTTPPQRPAEPVQEPVAEFDHGVGADRFKVVRGAFWWHILIGDSPIKRGKFHTQAGAEEMVVLLLREFRNGAFVQHNTAPPQQAEPC